MLHTLIDPEGNASTKGESPVERSDSFWTSDKLFGLTAMLVSLLTLLIFVRQTNIMDRQSRLSAMPYLMIESSTNGDAHLFEMSVVNYGVGPAIVDGMDIEYDGRRYQQDFQRFMTTSVPEMEGIDLVNWSSIYRGQAIPAGGRVVVLAVGADREQFDRFLGVMANLGSRSFEYEIRYRSIYDDRWRITSSSGVPERLD